MPRVDVRVVLFTVRDGRLLIALQERGGCQSLLRRDPTFNESLDVAAMHILDDEIGTGERYQEQLYSISHGSEGDWTVTVTHLALALTDVAESSTNSTAWLSPSAPAGLRHVDRMIVDYALVRLRAKLGYTAIAFHLLPPSFTLSEVQTVYEAVLDRKVDKRNFRRRIHAAGLLEGTGEPRREGGHRPARLYRLRTIDHAETYLTPTWAAQPEPKAANR
jgi:8-oxo-dGTP diphosphatase